MPRAASSLQRSNATRAPRSRPASYRAVHFGTTASGFEEVMLMDNQFDYGDSTRLLVLHVDEANSVAYAYRNVLIRLRSL